MLCKVYEKTVFSAALRNRFARGFAGRDLENKFPEFHLFLSFLEEQGKMIHGWWPQNQIIPTQKILLNWKEIEIFCKLGNSTMVLFLEIEFCVSRETFWDQNCEIVLLATSLLIQLKKFLQLSSNMNWTRRVGRLFWRIELQKISKILFFLFAFLRQFAWAQKKHF